MEQVAKRGRGRPRGSLNKRTLARIGELKEKATGSRANKIPAIYRQSLSSLRETAQYLGGAMAHHRPWNEDGSERKQGNYKIFMDLAELHLKYLLAITPYEAPRLNAITLTPQSAPRTVVNVTILNESGEQVWEDRADATRTLKEIEAITEVEAKMAAAKNGEAA